MADVEVWIRQLATKPSLARQVKIDRHPNRMATAMEANIRQCSKVVHRQTALRKLFLHQRKALAESAQS